MIDQQDLDAVVKQLREAERQLAETVGERRALKARCDEALQKIRSYGIDEHKLDEHLALLEASIRSLQDELAILNEELDSSLKGVGGA